MYKIETHLHVSEVSPCAKLTAEEMMRLYSEAGYNTVFISDHYKKVYFDKLGELPWEEKTKLFLSGYTKAKEVGEKYGVTVLPAAELAFVGTPNHYLVYGITKEFLDNYPNLSEKSVEEFYEIAKENKLLVIQAHPYREPNNFPTLDYVDGVEIYNSNPRHEDHCDKAETLCKGKNLYVTAGSDAHRVEDVGKAGMLSETPINTVEEFISLIKSGTAQIFRG